MLNEAEKTRGLWELSLVPQALNLYTDPIDRLETRGPQTESGRNLTQQAASDHLPLTKEPKSDRADAC